MKSPLLIAIAVIFITLDLYGQNYLESKQENILQPDLSKGIPAKEEFQFLGFEDNADYEYIQGLPQNSTVTSKSLEPGKDSAKILIYVNDIGRVVLYANIFNSKDSTRYNPLKGAEGNLVISAYRGDEQIESLTRSHAFLQSGYQQIYFNTFKNGIDKVVITFTTGSEDIRYLIGNIEVVPYTAKGIANYKEIEEKEIAIDAWTDSLQNGTQTIKDFYLKQLVSIEDYHRDLSTIISGQKFQEVARAKALSLNPFANDAFKDAYQGILDKASEADQQKFNALADQLKPSTDFTSLALSLDNIILGGKFGSMISLIDGLFNTQITVKNKSSENVEVLAIDGEYFAKSAASKGKSKLKLQKVDNNMKNNIIAIMSQNDAMKHYMSDISEFMQVDAAYYRMITEDFALAKRLKGEMEGLINTILLDCMLEQVSQFNFSSISTTIVTKFDVNKERETSELWNLKSAAIKNMKRFNDLRSDYYDIISRIKTHYDVLYEINPTERKNHFDSNTALPKALRESWSSQQQSLITIYTKNDGLQESLFVASGMNL